LSTRRNRSSHHFHRTTTPNKAFPLRSSRRTVRPCTLPFPNSKTTWDKILSKFKLPQLRQKIASPSFLPGPKKNSIHFRNPCTDIRKSAQSSNPALIKQFPSTSHPAVESFSKMIKHTLTALVIKLIFTEPWIVNLIIPRFFVFRRRFFQKSSLFFRQTNRQVPVSGVSFLQILKNMIFPLTKK
jgi:hypothetical protein